MKLKRNRVFLFAITGAVLILSACTQMESSKVLVTSESGDVLAEKENIVFKKEAASGFTVSIDLESKRQTIDGIGSSLTESSAFVLASISPGKRKEVLEELYGESGANFAITRTHIGSCDFSVEGKYSYAEVEGDSSLENFSLLRDMEGFSNEKYPNIVDVKYDLLPLIKEVVQIKKSQEDDEFRIVASPWTAPAWMKDNNNYFSPGHGGQLKHENYKVFANYFIKYFEAMKNEGIEIWGITPVNEPQGNNGAWESMHFTPEGEAEFVAKHLGPAIGNSDFDHVKIFGFDQNRLEMPEWSAGLLDDEESAKYFEGLAIHWYASTFKVFEEILDSIHNIYPNHTLLHTEGCIDNLGVPGSIDWCEDPEGWEEEGWFNDDSWWWHKNATDWGYKTPWGNEMHAMYAPVHRYARNIIVSLNNWMTGYIDWNAVLDKEGGPNHVGNFCGAPVMIDIENQDIYYTPVYHVLKHFSTTIRPGDVALKASPVEGELKDKLYVGATKNKNNEVVISMLNVTDDPIDFSLQLGDYSASISAPKNSIKTVIVTVEK
jgi:glucosylceramidase